MMHSNQHQSKEQESMDLCKKFIRDQEIWNSVVVWESDRVIANAHGFIEDICNIVGFEDDFK